MLLPNMVLGVSFEVLILIPYWALIIITAAVLIGLFIRKKAKSKR